MKNIKIVNTKPAQIHWTREAYKEVKASSCIYSNILFLVNSKKICEVEFYDKNLYCCFRKKDKIRIPDKCIDKHLYLIKYDENYKGKLNEKDLYS